jgi:hypothetical protein
MSGNIEGITPDWGKYGSASAHVRYMEPLDARCRRRCHCGCNHVVTHRGMCNGLSLMEGCLVSVAEWVSHC